MMFGQFWKLRSTQVAKNSSLKILHTLGPNGLQNCPYLRHKSQLNLGVDSALRAFGRRKLVKIDDNMINLCRIVFRAQ